MAATTTTPPTPPPPPTTPPPPAPTTTPPPLQEDRPALFHSEVWDNMHIEDLGLPKTRPMSRVRDIWHRSIPKLFEGKSSIPKLFEGKSRHVRGWEPVVANFMGLIGNHDFLDFI